MAATLAAGKEAFSFDRLIGESKSLTKAIDTARMIARTRLSTVLLVGETGTGKELFARGIHCEGPNASAPFVAVNCAAIPDTLLESELFGHEAGAFTGARARKIGLMELAGCGTLFLDEVHHLPGALQPKLLRALEDRRIRRLGGSHEIGIECRIIAAANIAIESAVETDQFREDLFYRLNVLRVDIPPLRARGADVELLARHFLAEASREHDWPLKVLLPDAVLALRAHEWPGNIRELKNVIERAAVVSGAERAIDSSHLLIQQRNARPSTARRPSGREIEIPVEGKTLAQIEQEAVQLTLQFTQGNQSRAARMLGISRPTLARILRDCAAAEFDLVEKAS
jgi:transcriptional regulator with PAS, ATPase and Fis domain